MNAEIYKPVPLNHATALAEAMQRPGFKQSWDALEEEYATLHTLLDARKTAGLTQEELAQMGNGHDVPTPIKHAIMMLGAHWYNQRESVSNVQMHAVPDSLQALIKPYRKLAE